MDQSSALSRGIGQPRRTDYILDLCHLRMRMTNYCWPPKGSEGPQAQNLSSIWLPTTFLEPATRSWENSDVDLVVHVLGPFEYAATRRRSIRIPKWGAAYCVRGGPEKEMAAMAVILTLLQDSRA